MTTLKSNGSGDIEKSENFKGTITLLTPENSNGIRMFSLVTAVL
jgi:hypothetical protein